MLNLDLEAIGREIARRCRGVPLAARNLGGIMSFKCDKSEWLSYQNDKMWDLLDDDYSDILKLLKLSFDHLPTPSLKQCFSYCSIFPKDDEIKKEDDQRDRKSTRLNSSHVVTSRMPSSA